MRASSSPDLAVATGRVGSRASKRAGRRVGAVPSDRPRSGTPARTARSTESGSNGRLVRGSSRFEIVKRPDRRRGSGTRSAAGDARRDVRPARSAARLHSYGCNVRLVTGAFDERCRPVGEARRAAGVRRHAPIRSNLVGSTTGCRVPAIARQDDSGRRARGDGRIVGTGRREWTATPGRGRDGDPNAAVRSCGRAVRRRSSPSAADGIGREPTCGGRRGAVETRRDRPSSALSRPVAAGRRRSRLPDRATVRRVDVEPLGCNR